MNRQTKALTPSVNWAAIKRVRQFERVVFGRIEVVLINA